MSQLVLKKHFHVIEVNPPNALVYFIGSRVLLSGSFVDENFNRAIEQIRQPKDSGAFFDSLKIFWSEKQIIEFQSAFTKFRFIEEIDLDLSLQIDKISEHEIFKIMGPIHSGFSSIAKAIETAEKTPIQIINRGAGGSTLQKNLIQLGFKNLQFVSGENFKPSTDSLTLVVAADYEVSFLRKINKTFHELKHRWLLISEDEFGGSVGPLFFANASPCYECLIERRFANSANADRTGMVERLFNDSNKRAKMSQLINEQLHQVASLEVLKIVTDLVYSKTYRGQFEFDFFNHRFDFHHLLTMPNCLVCQSAQPRREFKSFDSGVVDCF